MKLLKLGLFLVMSLFFVQGQSQEVTFAEDIAEIIYSHCSSCHRDGEIGPMPFTGYEEIRDWGQMIKYVTEIKYMPPWQPDPTYSRFLGENFLEQEEIDKIAQWVDDGMPRGDKNIEPDFPEFPDGSVLGVPDLVLEMAEAHLHKGTNVDDYRYFVIPSGLLEDKVVKAIEFRPGNPQIVHHALVFEDLTGEAARRDAETPEYGFSGFGSFNSDPGGVLTQKQFPGYVPGQKPILFPDATGQVMKAGSDIVIQVHYAPWPKDEWDQSKLNIFFAKKSEPIEREVGAHIMVPLPNVINENYIIPPNQVKTFHGKYTVPIDVSLIGLSPHMHLLGNHWEIYLEKKNGEKVNLIRINKWDFNWQGSYSFDRFIVAERGDVIHAIASYDNTTNNPNNPNDPPRWVTWGEKTTDEMYYLPINFVLYKPGDEDVVFDDQTTSVEIDKRLVKNQIFPIAPNPVSDYMSVGFYLDKGQSIEAIIYNMQGQVVRQVKHSEFFNTGINTFNVHTRNLKSGTYIIQLSSDELQLSTRFIKS